MRPSMRRVAAPARSSGCCGCIASGITGFNVRHFHQIARREHGVTVSYSFVKQTLQAAGLGEEASGAGAASPAARAARVLRRVAASRRQRARVVHAGARRPAVSDRGVRRRDQARAAGGVVSERKHAGGDDESGGGPARRRACPWRSTPTARTGRFTRRRRRGRWTRRGSRRSAARLARLGIEHIPAYSPQARGRSERLNRTFQDRLVNELRVAGIATLEAANRYLAEHFVPQHNATFARAPRDPASAFVPLGDGRSRR